MARTNNDTSRSGSSPKKTSPALNKHEEEVLLAKLTEWHSSTRDERKLILKTAISDALLVAPKMNARLLKERRMVCRSIALLCICIVHPDDLFCAPDL